MNERKTMFLAVGILLVAMLASNFAPGLSGYEVKQDTGTRIDINPNPVGRNQVIEVTVYPGPNGVKNEWMYIERNGAKMLGTTKRICNELYESVCYQSAKVTYLVGTDTDSWPSDATYSVVVQDNVEQRSAGGVLQKVYTREDFTIA